MTRNKKKVVEYSDKNTEECFGNDLADLLKNLFYVSETDSEIFPFWGEPADAITSETILQQLGRDVSTPVEERNFAEVFERLTAVQDWFGKDEKKTAKRFERLQNFLQDNLRDLKIFKIGKVEIDIYFVGLNEDGRLAGVWTKAIET